MFEMDNWNSFQNKTYSNRLFLLFFSYILKYNLRNTEYFQNITVSREWTSQELLESLRFSFLKQNVRDKKMIFFSEFD